MVIAAVVRAALAALLVVAALPAALIAQAFTVTPITQPRPRDSTYQLPLVPTRTVRFSTDEGTQMNVDVSPDGQTILFDLLGDLYTVPITGGQATRIMGGMAADMAPRYSPDGRYIVFSSDRSGQENYWVAEVTGRNPRPLAKVLDTSGKNSWYVRPAVWAPDGRIVITRGRVYEVATGVAREAPELAYDKLAFGGASRALYVATSEYEMPRLTVVVYDSIGGPSRRLFTPLRKIEKLAVSRDERWLVYSTVIDERTGLRLRDLRTGTETWLAAPGRARSGAGGRTIAPERGTGSAGPRFAFTPDGTALVATAWGKLWRIAIPSGEWTPIPFRADVELDLGPLTQFQYAVPDSFTVRQIREPRLSPDGTRLAFTALDKLYIMDFPSGTPRRVTTAVGIVENYPAWSPDGRYVAFATYSDLAGGHVYRVEAARVLAGRSQPAPERLTTEPDLYTRLAYNPDGTRLVYGRTPWRQLQRLNRKDDGTGVPVELFWMPAAGGAPRLITHLTDNWNGVAAPGAPIQFLAAAPDRLVVPTEDALVSLRWDGADRRTVLRWPEAGISTTSIPAQGLLSPDGRFALVSRLSDVYLVPVPSGPGDSLLIDLGVTPWPSGTRRLSRSGAEFPAWSSDGKRAYFALGRSLFIADVATAVDGAPPARHDVKVVVARDRAPGTLVLRGARLITMRGDEVIARGDIVIRDGRIAAVGPSGTVTIPKGVRVIDVTGKTVLPGYIDIHAHMRSAHLTLKVHKSQLPAYHASLAYGVTTGRDPQTTTSEFLTFSDRVAAGDMLGPRYLGTGPAVGQGRQEPVTTQAEVNDLVRRYGEFYRTQMLKQYEDQVRIARQWIVMACRELGLSPTVEGSPLILQILTPIVDGYPGFEHRLGVVYHDVALLAAAAGIVFDPTYLAGPTPTGENRMTLIANPHDDPRLRRYYSHAELDDKTVKTEWNAAGNYPYPQMAQSDAKVVATGGRLGVGAHGDLYGLGTHWEMWFLGTSVPNHEVLRAATINGARGVGHDRELGSLEPGKLADLQVLDGNPLEDLRQTTSIRYVMKDGRLYDAMTLDELWPRQRKLGPVWWQRLEPPEDLRKASR